jgi:hypothetical protein
MDKRFYYRFDCGTELGKKFRSLWRECDKAERAANVFAEKVGASQFYGSPAAFAGGVVCVSFDDTEKINKKQWRSVGKDQDGIEMWEPDVRQRNGVMVLPRRDFRPSDTATRIYARRSAPWGEVCRVYSLREWSEIAGIALTGDDKKDMESVTEKMKDEIFCRYIDLYCEEEVPTDNYGRKRRMPLYMREAIRIERERMLLPVVPVSRFYDLLRANQSAGFDDGKPHVVQETAPTFFEWSGRYYIGIAFPCSHESLEKIDAAKYNMKAVALKAAMRVKEEAS